MLPSERICKKLDREIGLPVSRLGFYKIRLFARQNSKNTKYEVNAVPYFLFNAIAEEDVSSIFDCWFPQLSNKIKSIIAKIRVMQYVIAGKLFKIWENTLDTIMSRRTSLNLNISELFLVFPEEICIEIIDAIDSKLQYNQFMSTIKCANDIEFKADVFVSKIVTRESQTDNIAVLQTRLIEPFTNLFFSKEKESRQIVSKYEKKLLRCHSTNRLLIV